MAKVGEIIDLAFFFYALRADVTQGRFQALSGAIFTA